MRAGIRAAASISVKVWTKSTFDSALARNNSTLLSGDGSFMRRIKAEVRDAWSADCSRTSATITSTAIRDASSMTGGGGNGGVVSD